MASRFAAISSNPASVRPRRRRGAPRARGTARQPVGRAAKVEGEGLAQASSADHRAWRLLSSSRRPGRDGACEDSPRRMPARPRARGAVGSARAQGPGAPSASPPLWGKTSSLSQRVSFLSRRVRLFLAKSRDSFSEWARFRKNKLAQSASELAQSVSPLISAKVPGLSQRGSSATRKEARSFSG